MVPPTDQLKSTTRGISHVKPIYFGYKMTLTLTSYNPIHLMFYYISRPFFVFLGPTLVNLGAILGMIKHSKALKSHKFVFLNSLRIYRESFNGFA